MVPLENYGIQYACIPLYKLMQAKSGPSIQVFPQNGELLTLEEVARFLRVSTATVRRWTNAGTLACYRLGGNRERRFSQHQVHDFLLRHSQEVGS